MSSSDLADALEVDSGIVGATIATPLKHGLIVKRLENNRAIYALAPADDGQPVRRQVDAPSVRPTGDALAAAVPFPSVPRVLRAPRVDQVDRPAIADGSPRFGVFSDGSLVIESGIARIELDATTARRFLELARVVVGA